MSSPTPIDPASVTEEDLPDNWVEKKSDALKDVLGEMTAVYNEANEPVELQFAEQSHADIHGEYIAVNPRLWDEFDPPVTGPNILRVLDEINSHEMGHYNWSDLEGKKEFGDMYPDWGEIPGHVCNILEDEYVDARKMREFYGLRRKRAYRVKLTIDTEAFVPDVNDILREQGLPNALVVALHQMALCGAVRGASDVPEEIVEFCTLVEPVISRIRRQDDRNERFKLFHVVMQILMRFVDDPDEFDAEDFREGPGKTISGDPEPAPDGDSVDPDDAMPDSFEEMVEDMIEEMVDDGELPFDPRDIEADDADDGDGSSMGIELDGDELESDEPIDPGSSIDLTSEIDDDTDGEDKDAEADSDEHESGGSDEDETTDSDGGDSTDGDAPDSDDFGDAEERFDDIDGGEAEHHVDDETMEEFADRDFEGTIEDRYDVNLDEVDKVDERDRAKWASLIRQLQDYGTDVAQRKRERDKRIDKRQSEYAGRREDRLSHKLKERAENAGVIRELEEGFRKLVSRGVPKAARQGTRIDPINVARRAAGDMTMTELFEEEQIVETGDRCVGIAADISGSMGGSIDELKIAGAAVGEATKIIGDEFVWEAFTDVPAYHGNPDKGLDLRVVTGPNEDFDWKHVDSFGAARNEPTAAGVRDCFQLMQQADANEYVMIVITDGMALITEDARRPGSNEPVEQARQAVNEVRSRGVDVIGLGIGNMDDKKMAETFGGENYRLTSIDNLAEDILDLYMEQMDTVKMR